MRGPIILVTASLAALTASADIASAASADEAMSWIAGRWTNKGDCGIGSVEFRRSGSGWTYREARLNGGATYPATASANASGVVTVQIKSQDYEYANTFRNKDTFDAVEGFTDGPMKGRRISKTYSRCK
jgi:ABC-type molybdate transport system substrate-binding protein